MSLIRIILIKPIFARFYAGSAGPAAPASERSSAVVEWLGATIKNLAGLDEISAAGMYEETGVRIVEVPPASPAAKAGLKPNHVILSCNGQPTDTVEALLAACQAAAGKGKNKLEVWRHGQRKIVEMEFKDGGRREVISKAKLRRRS